MYNKKKLLITVCNQNPFGDHWAGEQLSTWKLHTRYN